ncbi:MAG: NADH-quinone oxidoreductase subunit N [candidate division Zixibacteria bacterium]|nr:NADH-quinone oxidoreductase subunit N [candidate division Zixibacteria bacterium]
MVDYVSTLSIDFSLIYPEIALIIGAFLMLGVACSRRLAPMAPNLALLTYVVSLYLILNQWGLQGAGFADMVVCDSFAIMFKAIFVVASIVTILLAQYYLKTKGIDRPEFYVLMLISTVGMMAMTATADLVVMLIGLEVMSLPLYVLAGFNRRSLKSNEAGVKYFMMGAFASAFLLLGIAFIFGAAETTNLRRIVTDFSYLLHHQTSGIYLISGAVLVFIGFGFKIAAVPFHSWVPDVYEGAPTPVTAFFSVAPKAAAFAVLLRIFVFGFSGLSELTTVFSVFAVLTMSVGNILALRQDNVKRMLAYSSISHAGYIMVALAVGGPEGVSAAIFYIASYTMFNLGAFGVVTVLETRSGCQSDYSELTGLSKAHPYLACVFALFMFALAGFPPTVGFFGKFYLFSAAIQANLIWLTIIGVMNSFVSVYFYLRVVKVSFFDTSEKTFSKVRLTPAIVLALALTAIATLGIGLFPHQLLRLSQAAIFGLP